MGKLIKPIIMIILNTINLILLSICLLELKWKNLGIENLVFFLIMISFNFLGLIVTIFILLNKCRCDIKSTSCCFLVLYILVGVFISFTGLIALFVTIDEANYPCQKSSTSDGYYYVYYYYRRLTMTAIIYLKIFILEL